ncbi:MAG: hypothetical protein ACREXU_08025 [Gammaproteobacteria bacterium]
MPPVGGQPDRFPVVQFGVHLRQRSKGFEELPNTRIFNETGDIYCAVNFVGEARRPAVDSRPRALCRVAAVRPAVGENPSGPHAYKPEGTTLKAGKRRREVP